MSEEKEAITLDQQQVLEIEGIVMDEDKDAAFRFLKENIYKPIKLKRGKRLVVNH